MCKGDPEEQEQEFSQGYPIIKSTGDNGEIINTIFIFDEIGAPSGFVEAIALLDSAGPKELVIFKLNTPGGRLDAVLSLLDAIETTRASTVAEISGECASAGTMIALACDGLYISRFSEFMSHNFIGGVGGAGHEIKASTDFMIPNFKEFMYSTYKKFFTKKEIKKMLDGKPYHMGSEEVMRRWDNVLKYRAKQKKQAKNNRARVGSSV